MAKGDLLFNTSDLRAVLEGHERKMLEKIDAIDQKEFAKSLRGLPDSGLLSHYQD